MPEKVENISLGGAVPADTPCIYAIVGCVAQLAERRGRRTDFVLRSTFS